MDMDTSARLPWRAHLLVLLLISLLPLSALAGPVNVNTADAATLARELHGIGPAKAQAIVAHRDKHGPFRSADDLARVRGIGRKTVERNRDLVRFDGRPSATAPAAAVRDARMPPPGTKTVPGRSN
jgi:competence protein ComEA